MAWAAVRSKAAVLLLLIYCSLLLPLFVWALCLVDLERPGCYTLTVLLMSCDSQCSLANPQDALVSQRYVIVVFPNHTQLLF